MKRLWISFALVCSLSFAVLGWIGTRIYQKMPPIPTAVVSTDGAIVIRKRAGACCLRLHFVLERERKSRSARATDPGAGRRLTA
jgi:hypothetical protein